MKVAQFIGSKNLGGAENFFIRLNNALGKKPDRCENIALIDKNAVFKCDLTCSSKDISIRSTWDPLSKFYVAQSLTQLSPDIVQTWMGRATRLLPSSKRFIHVARLGGYYRTKHYQKADYLIGNTTKICDYLIEQGISASKGISRNA